MIRVVIPLALLALVVTLLPGCGQSSDPGPAAAPAVSAADRDASLDAIERWLTAGQPESGEAIARVLLRRLPEDPHVRLALARTLIARAGRIQAALGPDAARPLAREAAEVLDPAIVSGDRTGVSVVAWNRTRGLALETAGLDAEAIATYRETADRDRVTALYLALALLRVEDTATALDLLEDLNRNGEPDPYVLAALSEAQFDPAAPAAARRTIAEAVRLDPDAWAIRLRQASIERRAGDPVRAIEMLSALDPNVRTERVVCVELARSWRDHGRPDRSAQVWATRATAHPDDLAAALEAASLFTDAGRIDDAEAWIRLVEDTAPDDDRLAAARRRLASEIARRNLEDARSPSP